MKIKAILYLVSVLPLVTFLSSAVSAQEPAPKFLLKSSDAWREFRLANGEGWTADWNPATGTPAAIYGGGLALGRRIESLGEARAQAEALLLKYSALLGKGGSTFVEQTGLKVGQVYVFVYDQGYRGLRVIGGRADVRIHDSGTVPMFGSAAVQIPAGFGLKPALAAAAARARGEKHVIGGPGRKGNPAPRLVIWADVASKVATTPTLAWEVQIDERPKNLWVGKVYVDAKAGGVLEFKNEVYSCSCGTMHVLGGGPSDSHAVKADVDHVASPASPKPVGHMAPLTGTVMAWTNTGLSPLDPLKNIPLANLQVTSSAGSAYTDANGKFTIPYSGTGAVQVAATLVGKHSKRVRVATGVQMTASASITPGIPGTIQFGTSGMGHLDRSQPTTYYFVDDINVWMRSLLPTATTQMNQLSGMDPIVNIARSCNAFYSNFKINFYNESSTCNMTAFSTVVQHEWGHGLDHAFGGIIRTDGLSEGWADVVAIYRTMQPIVGQDFRKTGSPTYVRTGTNTRTYPVTGSTHAKGEVWMGWAWDLRLNLVASMGKAPGEAHAIKIVMPSIAANASTIATAVREVFILDDDDGNLGNGVPHYAELEKASVKRKLPYPKIQAGSLSHSALGNTDEQLTPRIARAKAVPNVGSFTKVELVYDTGSGAQRREMVSSGTANEYVALLPGVLSPASVSYHVEASHSLGVSMRQPMEGEFTYQVGKEETVFFDDFEKSSSAWTHNATRGTDDWAWGTPTGQSGSPWGVAWSDPSAAASGKYCWGNNLNGAYSQGSADYLRSPTLNLTGKKNVWLGFRRWLGVQQMMYDTASIKVNNTVVWSNPASGHLVDTAWMPFVIKIPQADNNPAVTLEWGLERDGGLELSGWNIDDVRVFMFSTLPPPKMQFTATPSQVGLGQSSSALVKGTANVPMLILVSSTPGPTQIPGLPTLFVGGTFLVFGAGLDSKGEFKLNFTAPTSPTVTGLLTYVQALELTNATTVTASNGLIVLYGK